MIQIQKAIRDRIQTELNKNTQGINFEVSLYNVKTNDLLENTEVVNNTYATRQKRFVPFLIESIDGEYADLQNLTALEASINASFMIPTDSQDFNNMFIDETFEKVSIALDELRQRTLANNLPLGDVSYMLPKGFRLKALNNTTPFNDTYIRLKIKFKDNSSGDILNGGSSLLVKREDEKLSFNSQGSEIYTFDTTSEVEYDIYIYYLGNNDLQISIFDGSTTTTEIIQNVTFSLDDLILGGMFLEIKNWTVGSISSGIITNTLVIEDFVDLVPTVGSESLIDTQNAKGALIKGELGTVAFGFSLPNPTTNQFTFGNGLNYQQFDLFISSFITDSVFVGNDIKYYLNEHRIFPIYRDEPFVSETDASQVVGQQITKHTATQSIISREYTVYLKQESDLITLAEKITSLTPNPNEVFTLRVEYPMFERTYNVIVTQGALGINNNAPVSLSLKFDLASNILS